MDETKQPDDRWRELADLLGIPEEKPGMKSAPAAPAPRHVEEPPPAPRHVEEPPPAPRHVEEPPPAPRHVEEPPPRHEPKIEREEFASPMHEVVEAAPLPPMPLPEWGPAPEEDDTEIEDVENHGEEAPAAEGEPAEPGAAPVGEEGEPRRGRRRRRRGRRRGGDRPEGEDRGPAAPPNVEPRSDDAVPSERPPRGNDADAREQRGRGRGRGRGRDRDDDRSRPAAPPRFGQEQPEPIDMDEPQAQPAPQDDALLAEDTDFSNWNVPSWQDLIASLYRPDR